MEPSWDEPHQLCEDSYNLAQFEGFVKLDVVSVYNLQFLQVRTF